MPNKSAFLCRFLGMNSVHSRVSEYHHDIFLNIAFDEVVILPLRNYVIHLSYKI